MLTTTHNIGVCGLGVIGGSFLLTAECHKGLQSNEFMTKVARIYGFDSNLTLQETLRDEWSPLHITFPTTFEELVQAVDVLVIAVPPKTTAEIIEAAVLIKPDILIIELCSVKNHLLQYSAKHRVVHAHPMAGCSKSHPSLFQDQTMLILSNDDRWKNDKQYGIDLNYTFNLFKAITNYTCKIKTVSEQYHDNYMAEISHLPQILSHLTAQQLTQTNCSLIGTGFRTITKVTQNNPTLWAEILLENKANVKTQISLVRQELATLQEALEADNLSALEYWFKIGPRRLDSLQRWSKSQ